MKILGNRCLVVPNPKHERIGSIYLPQQSMEDRHTGFIVLIGDGVDKRFDKRQVLFNKNVKENMVYEGLDAYLLYVFDIIAILD